MTLFALIPRGSGHRVMARTRARACRVRPPLTKRLNVVAWSLHALHMDSSFIAIAAGKHRVRLRRYEVTPLNFA